MRSGFSFGWRRALLGAALASAVLAACGNPQAPKFQSTDITGAPFGKDFRLTDHAGRVRTLADFKGKAVVLFFGYTQCPDVCPTTLAEVARALETLGKDAERVQVLFVTVDPARDTPELLSKYVPAFNPSFLGLTGTDADIKRTVEEFKVIYAKVPGKTADTYTMDHSAGSFVFDPQGRLRLLVAYGQGAAVFAHDLGQLLRSAS